MERAHHDVGAMLQLSPDQCRRAAIAVCGKATDSADAELLLEALGLRPLLRSAALVGSSQPAIAIPA
jgi:hypothetical protein